jgi:SAM-dependent methyltransferase
MTRIQKRSDGLAYLHLWRSGTAYESLNKFAHYKEWTNIRFSVLPLPSLPHILVHDIRNGIPYSDKSFDVIYCNHVFEHLSPSEGLTFLGELKRTLKDDGIIRLVVPDLELAAQEYLNSIQEYSREKSKENHTRYQWSVLNLIDQMVRDKPGGLMLDTLKSGDIDKEQILRTMGDVLNNYIGENELNENFDHIEKPSKIIELLYKIRRVLTFGRKRYDPHTTREINKWLYDRVSLRLIMEKSGFRKVEQFTYDTSSIRDWHKYDFDKSNYGNYPLEPSIYFEAIR